MNLNLEKALFSKFGFESFRAGQKEVISEVISGNSCLSVMATGHGKSLCYQLPSQILEGLTLVISPLIALMKDQVDQAEKIGIKCCYINSSLSRQERVANYKKLKERQYDLVYVTPERFRKQEFLDAVKENNIELLAIDEAHCISEWGHDFRPDYTKVGEFRKLLGNPPVLALTATATKEVRADIKKILNIEDAKSIIEGVERDNLRVEVRSLYGLDQKIQSFMYYHQKIEGACIVYFALISSLEAFARQLTKLDIDFVEYHGQLSSDKRKRNQKLFLSNKVPLILATPAFGLGVNKPNIRKVIHAEVPGSIEAYYQEIGRAGRDGEPAVCALLYDPDDVSIQMDFIKWANPDEGFVKHVYRLIGDHAEKVLVEGLDFLRTKMNFYNRRDFRLETALNLLERWGSIEKLSDRRPHYKALAEPSGEYVNNDMISNRVKNQNQKLLQLVQYAIGEVCRKNILYQYFEVEISENCNNCDACDEL